MSDATSRVLLSRFRVGDERAATEIFDRYVNRLIQLARRRLSPKLTARIDADDVVQSAWRSFFCHARQGDYVLRRAGDLWRLLAAITLHKLHGQIERHTAERRSVAREVDARNLSRAFDGTAPAADHEPTPDEVAAITEQLELFMAGLSTLQRSALESRLSGRTIEQIADFTRRSQRTVRRLLDDARRELERRLAES